MLLCNVYKMKFLYEETKNQQTESNVNFSACEPASPTPGSGANKRKVSGMLCPSSSRHKARQDAIYIAIIKQLETTDNTLNKSLGMQETDDN